MEFIDLKAQYSALSDRIDARIRDVLAHGRYILGPEVAELEARLAEYVGVRHVVTCANGTDALQLAFLALEIGPGDEVLCPTFTYFATAEAASLLGAQVTFLDVDPDSYNVDPDALDALLTERRELGVAPPRAIVAVDLFGLPADYGRLEAIATREGIALIEDAAQGFGGRIGERRAGAFGTVATTSFFPAKPLGCYGDGGAVFTDSDRLAEVLRSLRVHGRGADKYDNVRVGMNSRLDTLQAAILLEKLAAFPGELERRQSVAKRYEEALGDVLTVPQVRQGSVSAWAQYTVRHGERERVREELTRRGVPTQVYYGRCLHQQTAYVGSSAATFLAHAERAAEEVFSLPMHPYLDPSAQDRIIAAVREVVRG